MPVANTTRLGLNGKAVISLSLVFAVLFGAVIPLVGVHSIYIAVSVVVILVLSAIALLPRRRFFNDQHLWFLFVLWFAFASVYPSFISIQLPGLPWISPERVLIGPLAILFFYATRVSSQIGADIRSSLNADIQLSRFLALLVVAQALSVVTGGAPVPSGTSFLLWLLEIYLPLFVVLSVGSRGNRAQHLMIALYSFLIMQTAIGWYEFIAQRNLWITLLPASFVGDSDLLQRIVSGVTRFDAHRAQGSFNVSLSYAEFIVMLLPFVLFQAFDASTLRRKLLFGALFLFCCPSVLFSGSRLGIVGGLAMLGFASGLIILRATRVKAARIVGGSMLILLPFILVASIIVVATVPRVNNAVFGGSAHQSSNEGRKTQYQMAPEKIVQRPLFGHGLGTSGEVLGYRNPAGVPTIDSYILNVILDSGIIGFIGFYGLFVWAIIIASRLYVRSRDPLAIIAGPIAASLAAFLVTKSVLSQAETHGIAFVLIGMLLIVARRIRENAAVAAAAQPPSDKPAAQAHSRLPAGMYRATPFRLTRQTRDG